MSPAASTGSLSPEQRQAAVASLSSPDRVASPFGQLDFFDGRADAGDDGHDL